MAQLKRLETEKRFHIMCKITLDVEYVSGKTNNHNIGNKEMFSVSRVIKANTLSEAKNILFESKKMKNLGGFNS